MKVLWIHNWNPSKLPPHIINPIKGFRELDVNINLEYLGNLRSPKNVYEKIKYLKDISNNYDLIHSQYGSMCSYVGSFIRNTPKIMSLHGSDFNINNSQIDFNNLHTRIARYLSVKSINHYNHVISVSNRMKNEILNLFPSKKVTTIPVPIILRDFHPMSLRDARRKLNFDQNAIIIMFNIADMTASVKRLQLAINSIELLKKKIPNVHLNIVSNIDYKDVPLHVNASNIILLTSKREGWPNSIKEALACNIPFVSTDVSDLSFIAKKEESCKIAEPNINDITEKIIDSLNSKRDINLRKYVEHMDIVSTCKKIQSLYKLTIENFKN